MVNATVHAVDMSGKLNAEGKYLMEVKGKELRNGKWSGKCCLLDLSELSIDQIGVIVGYLNTVFDDCGLYQITGVSIGSVKEVLKPGKIEEEE